MAGSFPYMVDMRVVHPNSHFGGICVKSLSFTSNGIIAPYYPPCGNSSFDFLLTLKWRRVRMVSDSRTGYPTSAPGIRATRLPAPERGQHRITALGDARQQCGFPPDLSAYDNVW